MWYIYVDGACRGNPGKSGVGIAIKEENTYQFKAGFFIGSATNNQAEYWALIIALAVFINKFNLNINEHLVIRSDSQLLVNQLNGVYSVKIESLIKLYQKTINLLSKFKSYSVEHIYREKNSVADSLANEGIDKKNIVPEEIRQYIIKT